MLEVSQLSKRFEPPPVWLRLLSRVASPEAVQALSDVTFEVASGEVVGLVGANGAGKTTLLRTVAGLVIPSGGRVRVAGLDPTRDGAARRLMGIAMADDRGFYWRLNGRRNLELFGVLAGLTPAAAAARAGELLVEAGLAHRDRMLFGYSSGMITRLQLARAFLTSPPLLLLDEPTRSLDPVVSVEVRSWIRSAADGGAAVLFSSHDLDEVVEVCDRVLVLNAGEVVRDEAASNLRGPVEHGIRALLRAIEPVAS